MVISDNESSEELKKVWYKSKLVIKLRKLYMVANVLKYRSVNLIIFYCCVYSMLSNTTEVVIQNSMRLMRNIGFGPQVDG